MGWGGEVWGLKVLPGPATRGATDGLTATHCTTKWRHVARVWVLPDCVAATRQRQPRWLSEVLDSTQQPELAVP